MNTKTLDRILRNLKLLCIFDKSKRSALRKDLKSASLDRQRTHEVWGVSYCVFDGEELLEASILSIRNAVNYVNVVYSTISWYGEDANSNLLPTLQALKDKGLIDELIECIPDCEKKPSDNERIKRNVGLRAAQKFGCTYFMPMDTDEFYRFGEIIEAQKLILQKNITHAYCGIINYGASPCDRYLENGVYGVTFFSKLTSSSKFVDNKNTPTRIDPTRRLSHCTNAKYYVLFSVYMHHMSSVRKDLAKKMRNSSNKTVRKLEKNILNTEENRGSSDFINVHDEFNIGNINDA